MKIWSKVKGRDILRTLCRSVSAGSARFVRYDTLQLCKSTPNFYTTTNHKAKKSGYHSVPHTKEIFLNEILLSLIHLVEDLQSVIDQFFSLGEKLHFRKRKIQTVGCRPDYLK